MGVDVWLNMLVIVEILNEGGFDVVLLVIGIVLWILVIEGIEYSKVLMYLDVLCDKKLVGGKVVIIGVGGIGFDIVEYLSYGKFVFS